MCCKQGTPSVIAIAGHVSTHGWSLKTARPTPLTIMCPTGPVLTNCASAAREHQNAATPLGQTAVRVPKGLLPGARSARVSAGWATGADATVVTTSGAGPPGPEPQPPVPTAAPRPPQPPIEPVLP